MQAKINFFDQDDQLSLWTVIHLGAIGAETRPEDLPSQTLLTKLGM
jgi:hypothetical protein